LILDSIVILIAKALRKQMRTNKNGKALE